jgi:hypothetical protein
MGKQPPAINPRRHYTRKIRLQLLHHKDYKT